MNIIEVEQLCRLMVQYELESLECEGVKVTKRLHRLPEQPKPERDEPMTLDQESPDDALLFYSSVEPRRSVADLAHLAPRPGEETKQ